MCRFWMTGTALWGLLMPAALMAQDASSPRQEIGVFTSESAVPPVPWRLVRFKDSVPPTEYRIRAWAGEFAIEARANASMALLARPIQIDLARNPILCWRWRVDAPIAAADLRKKSGDDYAARVYVAFRLSPESMSWATRSKLALARSLFGAEVPDAALNYVWDNSHPVGTVASNAYTERAMMVVTRSGAEDAGRWVSERRDVLADSRAAFGAGSFSPVLLAVASDADDTGGSAHAGFARLRFVARDESCD
ncbi:MAG: DUF3047 domain-containing protein [Burkholderiales bacterium]